MWGIRLIAVAALSALPASAQNFEEPNTQRWGADYARFAMNEQSAADCARACAEDGRCQSWTFVKAGVEGKAAACHLKNAVPHGRADPCCISGVSGGSSVSAFAHVAPRARMARASAPETTADMSSANAPSEMTPTGMTGSIGANATMAPTGMGSASMTPIGMTGSIGAAPRLPALPPLAAPVTAPATDGPLVVRPESWEDGPRD